MQCGALWEGGGPDQTRRDGMLCSVVILYNGHWSEREKKAREPTVLVGKEDIVGKGRKGKVKERKRTDSTLLE